MKKFKIFTINPGSTSTKIALFLGDEKVFSENVKHDANILAGLKTPQEQLEYRQNTINEILKENKIDLTGLDACVGRGGGLLAMEGGVYEVDDLVLNHSISGANGVIHPANSGASLAHEYGEKYRGKTYVVNPPDVDELCDLARLTGIKDVYRVIHLHALNLKETAIRHSNSNGVKYEETNYIVCHIGGGISVSAHEKGKMIDGFDIVGGEGPMAPTRCGSISVSNILEYIDKNGLDAVKMLRTKNGGFVSHLGTSDALEVFENGQKGDKYSQLVWDSMIYQINKAIGAMSTVLKGKVEGILLSGGMVYNQDLVKKIRLACDWIAPVYDYPGEFEMEAMAAGATRVLSGEEKVKKYTGKCRFEGFDFVK
ncbi:MAG: butyrate kinase [Lachnospiraceae bacterium]|jgi:butyrate kinase|nr:butyrate kinase [Lachnospiraceae bacterium]